MTLGERIKTVRKSVKLTQVEFGEKIGIKGNTVTNYESNVRVPQEVTLKAICDKFGISYEWLKYGEGEISVDIVKFDNISAVKETEKEYLVKQLRLLSEMSFRSDIDIDSLCKLTACMVDIYKVIY